MPKAKAVAKAVPKAKALPKAAPCVPKPPWATVLNAIPAQDRIERNGIFYYHARRLVAAMGLRSWEHHLTEKVPMCVDEFGWVYGSDYLREAAGHRGVPPYWLSVTAALAVYQRYA